MRAILVAILSLGVQTNAPIQQLPPPYPRTGAEKILDNPQVQVWNITWPKGVASPLHRHVYDLVGVYYEPGDRLIIKWSGESAEKVSTKAWDIAFQRKDVAHIEEGISDAPLRAVFIELKQDQKYGGIDKPSGGPPPFAGTGGTQKADNDRAIVWEYASADAAARVPQHVHLRDAVVVAINGQSPRATWIPRGTVHAGEGGAPASRIYVFELK